MTGTTRRRTCTPRWTPACPSPATYAAARRLLVTNGIGLQNWHALFAGQQQWTLERAVSDHVNALLAPQRSALLREITLRCVLASNLGAADALLRAFGALHSLPTALLCVDIVLASDDGHVRAETEAKARFSHGNWTSLARMLGEVAAGRMSWRNTDQANSFLAGVPAYLAQYENISQAEYTLLTPQLWSAAGYRARYTRRFLWTAAPRRTALSTWKDAVCAPDFTTTRWLATSAAAVDAASSPAVRNALSPADLADLRALARMTGSA